MLYILLSELIIFPVLVGFGHLFQRFFGAIWNGVSAKMVQGIFLLMVIWHILAFFYPINSYVEIVSLLLGWGMFLYFRLFHCLINVLSKEKILWGLSFCVFVAVLGSGYPFILDHFGYYVPSIKWISEVGLVRGITNLDWVLGQMSPWHIFQAGFSHFSDEYLRFNTLLVMVFFLYIIERKVWVMFCFLPILFFFLQSPSPDLPSIVFALMILNEVLSKNQKFSLLFVFSMLVFSIKPTMFWLPILTFFYPVICFGKGLKFMILGGFIGVLYVFKNIWVFGYPFFPIQVFDVGISWKPYEELFVESRKIAVLKTFDLQYTLEEIARFSLFDYFRNWLFLSGIKGVINTAFILTLFIFVGYAFFRRNKIMNLILISVLLKSLFVLWFSAQYRFFIEVFFVFFVLVLGRYFCKKNSLIVLSVLSLIVANILFFPKNLRKWVPSFNLGYVMQDFNVKQLYKPFHYEFNKKETYQVGNFRFNVPKRYVFGFDVELPVLTLHQLEEFYKLNIFPKMKGKTLKEGFLWEKLEKEDKVYLKEIIEKIRKEE